MYYCLLLYTHTLLPYSLNWFHTLRVVISPDRSNRSMEVMHHIFYLNNVIKIYFYLFSLRNIKELYGFCTDWVGNGSLYLIYPIIQVYLYCGSVYKYSIDVEYTLFYWKTHTYVCKDTSALRYLYLFVFWGYKTSKAPESSLFKFSSVYPFSVVTQTLHINTHWIQFFFNMSALSYTCTYGCVFFSII